MASTCLISPTHLFSQLDDPNLRIVDCRFALADLDRGRKAYQESHLPGARYAHLEEDLSGPILKGVTGRHPLPDPESFRAKLGAWGIERQNAVVLYDDANGAYAARMWWMMRWLGHERVTVLDGVWKAWIAAGYPVSAALPHIVPTTYEGAANDGMVWDAETLWQELNAGRALVVDARETQRFLGEKEPIDSVAGRIPGAISRPYLDNLNELGEFKSPEILAARFADLKSTATRKVVVYCGSGVTAAHNLLAMHHAGLEDVILYAGSWSDWIAPGTRPIATGPA